MRYLERHSPVRIHSERACPPALGIITTARRTARSAARLGGAPLPSRVSAIHPIRSKLWRVSSDRS